MLYFSRWKITFVSLLVLAGFFFAMPNLLSLEQREKLPAWMPALNLGLDLQGGVHLVMQVDRADMVKARMERLEDDTRIALRQDRSIRFRQKLANENTLDVQLTNPEDTDAAKKLLEDITAPVAGGLLNQRAITEISLTDDGNGLLQLQFTDAGVENLLSRSVLQSIEVINNRINQLGTTEPVVQRQGNDRILIQVPGLEDPQRLKDIIGTTAKLTFQLVDEDNDVNDAIEGRPPPGDEVLVDDSTDPPTPYLLKKRVIVEGEDLDDAQPGFDQNTNEPIVTFRFNSRGGAAFGRATTENVGKRFAIVLDDTVISAPVIRQAIIGGSGQISGNFTVEGANDLAVLLRAGALPAKLDIMEERTVGPSLGADSIADGAEASLLGACLVIGFMLLAYGWFGVIANVALFANVAMIIALLSVIGATLTLPGIAGIVLTMGMAVDSNVLIFERIREDKRNGRNLIQSIDTGFRTAFATILDANVTTMIAAIILFFLGSGPVRGFAVTLAIGIITTVFTAYLFTRLMVALWVRYRKPRELPRRFFAIVPDNTNIHFMKLWKLVFPLGILGVLVSVVLFSTMSLNYGIDFRGGTLMEVKARDGAADIAKIRAELGEFEMGDVQVQSFGSPSEVLIRVEAQGLGDTAEQTVVEKARYALEENYEFRRVEVVGPTVSSELATAGLIAVIVSLLAIMVYIWFRFEWQFAMGAVIATAHDVFLTIGVFSLLQLEFNLSTIAAVLTIVGYSLNDTVVVFDRIRENLRKFKKKPIPEVIDQSINQMLSRTLLTSITTLLALFSIYFFGGDVLESFSFAMIFGVFVGTFSSIYIASPVLIYFNLRPGQITKVQDDIAKEKQATANTAPVDFG